MKKLTVEYKEYLDLPEKLNPLPHFRRQILEDIRVLASQTLYLILQNTELTSYNLQANIVNHTIKHLMASKKMNNFPFQSIQFLSNK